jgi:hypothetical protein
LNHHEVAEPVFPDRHGEHRTKTVPLEPHRFMANVAATFMQQIPAIATRKQETDIDHHGHPDDLS